MAFVTTKEMFKKAYEGGYAVGAFNVNNMEIIQGITEAAIENRAPLVLQVSKGARAYAKHVYLMKLIEAAIEDAEQSAGFDLPICVHLDHGDTFELCKSCIDGGFTSVMIDGSSKSFEDNIALTKQVVEYAHDHGVVVEGELGTLAGVEDEVCVSAEDSSYTRPEEVEEFVSRTGVDSLAIAIGTSHGAYKFTAAQCTRNEEGILMPPPLRFDILDEVSKRLPGFPIVLHGASSVPQEFVKIINQYGGKMPDAVGIPEDQLRIAAQKAVCKINIDSDLRLAMTASLRKYFVEHPEHFDPRQYLSPARTAIKEMVSHKMVHVLGCNGKA
ncbi:MAG: class II fructose-1,6-bisphosphate aldolase [Christensenellales bacterium]|mgnify:FL=1|jgi:fructose-bisphosphate aldolase class II